jgi:hypothetical protein
VVSVLREAIYIYLIWGWDYSCNDLCFPINHLIDHMFLFAQEIIVLYEFHSRLVDLSIACLINSLLVSNVTPSALDSSRVLGPDRLCSTRVIVVPMTWEQHDS